MAYTVPTTQAVGNLIDAPTWNADIVENIKYLKGEVDSNTIGVNKLDDVSVSSVTGSRAIATSYQNTSGKIRVVLATIYSQASANDGEYQVHGQLSPDNSAWTSYAHDREKAHLNGMYMVMQILLIVPCNYYYKIIESTYNCGAGVIQFWTEWDLH